MAEDLPEWIKCTNFDIEAYLRSDDEDEPIPEMYLKHTSPMTLTTSSELQLAEGLKVDQTLYQRLEQEGEWASFVLFVKKLRREILGRGYETPQQCYYAYKHYMDSVDRNPDMEWKLPHIRTMLHPVLEKIKFPAPDEPITEEFKAYVYYSLLDETNSTYLQMVNGSEKSFQTFLEYCRFYKLWHHDWPTLCETFLRMRTFQGIGDYNPGFGPYEEKHLIPLPEQKLHSKSRERLRAAETNKKERNKNFLDSWANQNKKRALDYLRARRHHEHDKRYDRTLPDFNMAPPVGMERIARSQVDYDVFMEDKYRDQFQEYTLFGETPEEYDYLELLEGQGKREGDIMENPGVLPHMKNLYNESLIDPEVVAYEKRRKQRQERLPWADPWPEKRHKEPDQILLTDPYGQDDGLYLTRPRQQEHGPLPEGALVQANSDEILARISTLSLAELVGNTDHNTEMERRRLLLVMDQVVRYNRKLICIFQDVIDHIGPWFVSPPTQWDFAGAQEYLSKKKLECEKWERVASVKAEANEREDLFTYYNGVKQYIHNTARDIGHEAQYTIQQLTRFVETVQASDAELVATWFEDAVGPSCQQYISDLRHKEQQIENLMAAVEKVKVYKTLMSVKDTNDGTLFDDDIYHEIVKLRRENEALKDNVQQKEHRIEESSKTSQYFKRQIEDIEKSKEKFVSQAHSLEVYAASLHRNVDAEKATSKRLQNDIIRLEGEHKSNEMELKSRGLSCEELKPGRMALIKDTQDMLEATNTKLLSDLNLMDREIAEYEDLLAKKSANIANKTIEVSDAENMVKVYKRQKNAKEVFLTKILQENATEKETLAKQLAKKLRVKTGTLVKFYKEVYWSDDNAGYRGQPKLADIVAQEYNQYMDQYQRKMLKLSETIEEYRDLKEQSEQLQSVIGNVGRETQLWRKMGDAQKIKNKDISRKCGEVQRNLKKEAHKKDELSELLARTETRATENEKFRLQAEAAVNSAKNATTEPTKSSFSLLLDKVKKKSHENEKRQLGIRTAKQEMRKKANNFRNLLITMK